jgi:hypothetical protein
MRKGRSEKYTTYKIFRKKDQFFAIECTWNIFHDHFWPTVDWKTILKRMNYHRLPYKEVTAIATWTEIISTIKGSFEAHLYEDRHLPFKQY